MARSDHPVAAVVIPAAGAGTRLGGRKKQFRLLGGKPLLVQTVLRFQHHPGVGSIVIAAPHDELEEVQELCSEHGLTKVVSVVPGGNTRQESVRAGLESLDRALNLVLTHDAVRPFVSIADIDALLSMLASCRAAVLAAPVTDTLCRSVDGRVEERVEREGVFRLFTPQGFHRDVLEAGHRNAAENRITYTDEVTLVRAIGVPVTIVPSLSPNLKITTSADWEQALWMWTGWEARSAKRETLNEKR